MFVVSCTESKKQKMFNDKVILRVHTSKMDEDSYEVRDDATKEKFIEEFRKVDWETEFWSAENNGTFSPHSIEAINMDNGTFLGVTVMPNTMETFQYFLDYGTHTDINDSTVHRKVKLYGIGSDEQKRVVGFINLYFQSDLTLFENELKEIDFFDEIEYED